MTAAYDVRVHESGVSVQIVNIEKKGQHKGRQGYSGGRGPLAKVIGKGIGETHLTIQQDESEEGCQEERIYDVARLRMTIKPSECAEKIASTGNCGELTSFIEILSGGEVESCSRARFRGRCRLGEVSGPP